ncbi:MAG: hypothetical protein ACJ8FY_12970 [Gemmataceae bacterium]
MATVRERPRLTPVGRHEQVVESQLNKALSRIRVLDLTTGFLSFLALTLGFSLIMALMDRWLSLPLLARQIALVGYGATVAALVAIFVVRPLLRRINPYYAARQVEKTLPSAKNSVVNWLDLRDEPIAHAILGAVGQKAAHDLAQTDLEQAISGKQAAWLGSVTGILVVAQFIALIFWGFPTFSSLWGRTFAPFNNFGITSKTRIEVKTKDVTVPVDHAVTISVAVAGKVPDSARADALKLHIRYRQGDPYEEPILLEPESERDWFTTVPVTRVQSGFWYKVSGGDYETEEYRVIVRSLPMITGFDVQLHYRPYLGWVDKSGHNANLHDVVGTQATLIVHTNRPVSKGTLVFEPADKSPNKKQITSTPVKDDAKAMSFGLVLESTGVYRIKFISADGESSADSPDYTITVIPDNPPKVDLTRPGDDSSLPAIGTLQLEGFASDDFGIKQMTLRMTMNDGTVLKPKPYREGKSFKLGEDGGYPQMLEYKDFVELAKLKSEIGQPLNLLPGAVIEYWLEAEDAFDMPAPHVSQSKHYKLTIAEPEPDKKREQEDQKKAADQAKQEQRKHEKNQDEKLKQEKQQLQEKNEDQKDKNKQDQQKNDQSDSGAKNDENKTPGGKPENKDDAKKDDGKNPDSSQKPHTKPDGKGDQSKEASQDKSKNEANQDKDPSGAKNPDSKPDSQPNKDQKSDGDKNPDTKSNGNDNNKNKDPNQADKDGNKGEGADKNKQSADAKDNPNPQGQDLTNQAKDLQKKIEDRENQKGKGKDDPADKKGEEKGPGKPQPAPDKAQGKDNAKNQQPQPDKPDSQDAKAKNQGDPNAAGSDQKSDKKDRGKGQQPDQKPANAKDNPPGEPNAGTSKNDSKPQDQQGDPNADAKDHGKPSPDKKQNAQDKKPDAQEGASKGEGNSQSKETAKSEEKDAGKGQPDQKAADSKDKPQGKESTGAAKNDAKPDQPSGMGDKKDAGKEGADKNVAKQKDQAGAKPDDKKQEAQAKNEGKPDPTKGAQDKAAAKAEKTPKDKADKKDAKADGQAVADSKKPQSNKDDAAGNAGEKKPAPKDEKESTASAKGEQPKDKKNEQQGNGSAPAKDAKPEDVKKLAEHMKGDDADKKDAAERQLKDIAKDAKDAQARKDAQKALQDAKKDGKGEDKVADAKKPPMKDGQPKEGPMDKGKDGQPKEGPMDKGKDGTGDPNKGPEKKGENTAQAKKDGETGKDGDKKGQPNDAGESAKGNPKDSKDPKDPKKDGDPMNAEDGSNSEDPKNSKPDDKGKATGNPTTGGDPTEAGKARQTEEPLGSEGDPRFRNMANEMQLKNVRESLDKKLLDGSMTEDEKAAYKDWLKKYQEYKRTHPEDSAETDPAAPKASKHVNSGVRQFTPGKSDKASNPKSAGGGTAPPEFGPDSFIRPSKPASRPERK